MARFLVLNFEDFGLTQDITKSIQSQTLFCLCCLDKNVPFIDLNNCPHASYLDAFQKPQMNSIKHVICHHCHEILKKIDAFKDQVLQSFNILTSETFTPSNSTCLRQMFQTNSTVNITLDPVNTEISLNETFINTSMETDTITQILEKTKPQTPKENKKQLGRLKREKTKVVNSKTGGDKKESVASDTRRYSLAEVKIEFEPGGGEILLSTPTVKEAIDQTVPPPDNPEPNQLISQTDINKVQAITTVTLTKDELMRERVQAAQSNQYLKCPYRCENCIIGFHYEENVIDHMIRRHGPKVGSITCEICLQVLYPPGSLNAHNFRHYTRYDCTRCSQRYPTFDDAMAHYRKMHRNKDAAFKCRLCKFYASSYSNLKVHKILQHHKNSCKYCGVMMSTSTNLAKHLRTVHKKRTSRLEPEPANCSSCNLTFKNKYALELHMTRSLFHVQRDDRYTCSACGMRFASVSHLRMHAAVHGDRARHACQHCPMEFTLELEMLEHIESKHVERSQIMICDLCGRAYKNRHFFMRHMSVHNVLKRKIKGDKTRKKKKIV